MVGCSLAEVLGSDTDEPMEGKTVYASRPVLQLSPVWLAYTLSQLGNMVASLHKSIAVKFRSK